MKLQFYLLANLNKTTSSTQQQRSDGLKKCSLEPAGGDSRVPPTCIKIIIKINIALSHNNIILYYRQRALGRELCGPGIKKEEPMCTIKRGFGCSYLNRGQIATKIAKYVDTNGGLKLWSNLYAILIESTQSHRKYDRISTKSSSTRCIGGCRPECCL